MTEEFCLSDKAIFPREKSVTQFYPYIYLEDVKEFIRLLKEAGEENDWDIMLEQGDLENGDCGDITISFNDWIDKLAGEKLI